MRKYTIFALGAATLAACGSGDLPSAPIATPSTGARPVAQDISPASSERVAMTPESLEEWRIAISKAPLPNEGCFRASRPGAAWEEVPCGPAPTAPRPLPARLLSPARVSTAPGATPSGEPRLVPEVISGANDFNASVSGLLTSATGSFPLEVGGANESDNNPNATNPGTNSYSLQMNTNLFASPACNTSSTFSCQGWEQLVYDPQLQRAYFEFSLVNYVGQCPAPFVSNYFANNGTIQVCYFNSAYVNVPEVPASNLANVAMLGSTNATTDTLTMVVNGVPYAIPQPSVLGLANGWNDAEFNVYGEDNGTQASFTSPTALAVQVLTQSAVATTAAPRCPPGPTTNWGTVESNTLNLIPGVADCCAFGGSSPGIIFEETNTTASAPSCRYTGTNTDVSGEGNVTMQCTYDTNYDPINIYEQVNGVWQWIDTYDPIFSAPGYTGNVGATSVSDTPGTPVSLLGCSGPLPPSAYAACGYPVAPGANGCDSVAASVCFPLTSAACQGQCGDIPDLCGGTITCPACCTPETPAQACAGTCGEVNVGDGCGGNITCDNACACVAPLTCQAAHIVCGTFELLNADGTGCGTSLECGTCPSGEGCWGDQSACCPSPGLASHGHCCPSGEVWAVSRCIKPVVLPPGGGGGNPI